MPGETSTASCAGAPSGAGRWWSSGWRWPVPPSSAAGSSAAPGPATAGTATHAAAHDLLAQALSRSPTPWPAQRPRGGGAEGHEHQCGHAVAVWDTAWDPTAWAGWRGWQQRPDL